jgi:hypothetical protein
MNKKNKPASVKEETAAKPAPERKQIITLFSSSKFWLKVIVIGQMILLGLQFTPNISTNGDDAVYYILGQSIATGHGYRNIQLAGSPVETNFPIAFPSFLAFIHLFTDTPLLSKILVACLGCLATIASFYLFRVWAPWFLIPLVLLIGSLSVLNQHALELLSEIPYVAATVLSLILLEKSYRDPKSKWLFWLAVFVSILPMNCRSIGMAYSGAFIIAHLLNKKYRYSIAHFGLLAASILAVKILTSWNATSASYFSHLFLKNSYDPEQGYSSMSEMLSRVFENIGKYATQILPDTLMPSFIHANPNIGALIGLCLSALILIGCIRSLFLPFRLIGIYAVFYCGIISLWQVQWSSGRFLAGILPFLVFLLFLGISTIGEFTGKIMIGAKNAWKSVFMGGGPLVRPSGIYLGIIWCIATLLAYDNISFQAQNAGNGGILSRDWVNFFSCADWIRENTPKDAIVVSRKTEHVYLRSLRQGMIYPFSHDKEKVIEEIKKKHASYILVDGFYWTGTTQRYLYPALSAHPELYQVVYALRNPDTFVLRMVEK